MSQGDPKLTRRSVLKTGAIFAVAATTGRHASGEPVVGSLPHEDYARHDALGLAELVRRGELHPAELLEAAISRTEAVNPKINAVVLEHFARARKVVQQGLPNGPFRGVPFVLKDLHAYLDGTITTQGSRFFEDAVAHYTNTLVDRYRAAGLVIFGKTASPEFGASPSTNWQKYKRTVEYTAAQYEGARQTIHRVGRAVAKHQKGYDAVLSPTMAWPPVKLGILSLAGSGEKFIEAATAASAFTMLYNATGQPAMSLPLHWNDEGLPVGVMFAASFGDEATLFRLAGQIEAARPWRDKRAPL